MSFIFGMLLIVATFVLGDVHELHAGSPPNHPWFFTAEEIEAAYRYQETFGKGPRNPLRARTCLLGMDEFIAAYQGMHFLLPCRFITETLRHLKEMLEAGAARYLFPLDADHAHLAIPNELWEKQYRKLPPGKVVPALLEDPRLVALYHTAEHLTHVDPKTGEADPTVQDWKDKRNVLGFYDGRAIEILPPDPRGFGVSVPEQYHTYGGFSFLASPYAQLGVFLERGAIAVDISLDMADAPLGAPSRASASSSRKAPIVHEPEFFRLLDRPEP